MPYPAELNELASRYGIMASFVDVSDNRQEATTETLLRILRLLGAPLERMDQVPDALREHRRSSWQSIAPPVVVGWEGKAAVPIRLPEDKLESLWRYELTLEDGEVQRGEGRVAELPTRRGRDVDGKHYVIKRLRLAEKLPWGYHVMALEVDGQRLETMILSAPQRAYPGEPGEPPRWGVFLPLYALHRRSSWGAGDFSDLMALMQWLADQGGSTVATLPLLAANSMEHPSPYAPCSRLFWNEFYLDVTRTAEFARSAEARRLVESREVQEELEQLRRQPLVDYARQMTLKRRVLEILKDACYSEPSCRAELEEYLLRRPEVRDYARFRAASERQTGSWHTWTEPQRSGALGPADCDEAAYRYHLYAQWQAERQLESAAEQARASNLLWYLDYPLGVNVDGYDVWRNQDVFALGASGGAPPDTFFTKGQNWGFPPPHPEKLRKTRYRYFIDSLRRHLRYANLLRIDHVMSFHRLFWVPDGLPATRGAYVRYPMDEMFAVLTLESHRHRARIVGENLGTVPPEVDEALKQHGVGDMYVAQYEVRPQTADLFRPVPATAVASLNTHDMPPFATFWTGLDVDDRVDLGLVEPLQASKERDQRATIRRRLLAVLKEKGFLDADAAINDVEQILEGCLGLLAQSPAAAVLVNLEDLWAETRSQNTPGTFLERPNWRRRSRYTFEQFSELPQIRRILERLAAGRNKSTREPL